MAVSYSSNDAGLTSDKPRLWSDRTVTGDFPLHPDGDGVAIEAAAGSQGRPAEKAVIVTNAFDEICRLAPK